MSNFGSIEAQILAKSRPIVFAPARHRNLFTRRAPGKKSFGGKRDAQIVAPIRQALREILDVPLNATPIPLRELPICKTFKACVPTASSGCSRSSQESSRGR